ncbi:MAG: phage tail protein I, partial [Burkholderia sp.]
MGDFVMPSLLVPPLARDLNAHALETAGARALSIDLTPLLVADFDTVPASALPALAEQWRMLGDAGWNLAATEAQQRALLKEAGALHRMRGTPWAVMRVLEILGLTGTFTEWFNMQPLGAPYTFTISLDVQDQAAGLPPLDMARWALIARLINFWGLLEIVWVNFVMKWPESQAGRGFAR